MGTRSGRSAARSSCGRTSTRRSEGLAQVLAGSGRLDEAEALLRDAIQGNSSFANYFMLGTIEYRAGKYAAAADAFKRATDAAPNNAGAYTMLGNSQYIQRNLQQRGR